jgi:hypothetical protein
MEHAGRERLVVHELQRQSRDALEQPLAVTDRDRVDQQGEMKKFDTSLPIGSSSITRAV